MSPSAGERVKIPLEWEDQLQDGEVFETEFVGTLRPGQQEAVDAMAAHRLGVLCAPPGAGKTVMASALIARHGRNTLILVHRQPLLEQWKLRLSTFLGLAPKDIGVVGGGKDRHNGRLDIAMIQSLVRDTQVADWIAGYGQVIIDECHHVPAVSVEKVLKEVKARCVYGLTATLRRKDGLQKILYFQCGPIRHQIKETAESRLDTLVLAMPMSWKGTQVQYAGRIMREHEGKRQVRIVDYADEGKLLRSMLRKRQRVWAALGFKAGM